MLTIRVSRVAFQESPNIGLLSPGGTDVSKGGLFPYYQEFFLFLSLDRDSKSSLSMPMQLSFSPSPLFSVSDVGSVQQSEDKVSLHLYLRYVCRYNSAVAEGQLRRCRCLWKLSRCLNLLCLVKVTLSPAIWKMKQNARIEFT